MPDVASPSTVTVDCIVCSASFTYQRKPGPGRKRRFCSEACEAVRKAEKTKESKERHGPSPRRPIHQKQCVVCGETFKTGNSKTQCCGLECGWVLGKKKGDATRSAKALERRERTCQQCGEPFLACHPSAEQLRTGKWGLYCSRSCAIEAMRVPERLEPPRGPSMRYCIVCEQTFFTMSVLQKICSDACEKVHRRRQAREFNERNTERDLSPRECPECGTVFSPVYGDKRAKFCSTDCGDAYNGRIADKRRNARMRGAKRYENVDPIKVFDRDGWKCHLCGRKTPKKLRGTTDDRAPELDHLMPVSKGGSHTYDNVACACRKCNIEKSDRPMGQLGLFCEPVMA